MLAKIVLSTGAFLALAGLGSGLTAVVLHNADRTGITLPVLLPEAIKLDPFVLDPRRLTDLVPMVCQPASMTGGQKTKAEVETPDGERIPLLARKPKR